MKKNSVMFLTLLLFLSCSTKTNVKSNADILNKPKEPIEEVASDIICKVALAYYDYESKPIINICLKTESSDKTVDSLFQTFVHNALLNKFSQAGQINVVKKPDVDKDCSVSIDLTLNPQEEILLKTNVFGHDNQSLLEKSCSYKVAEFGSEEYETFKIKYAQYLQAKKEKAERDRMIGNTRLKVIAHSNGTASSKAKDRSLKVTRYFEYGDSLYSTSRNVKLENGFNSYYPMELECRINGKDYKADYDNIIFDGKIEPGSVEFIAKFKEAYWDGYNRSQVVGKQYQRKFRLNIDKNDNIKIDFGFNYDGKKASILTRVLKEYTIVKNGKKEKVYKEVKLRK